MSAPGRSQALIPERFEREGSPVTAICYINGKFSAQPTTGVQRVAARLLQALDARAGSPHGLPGRWVLLCPPAGQPPALRHIECRVVGRRAGSLHLWEQLRLPLAARDGCLLNLAGSAPFAARRQVCMIHDAAVFDHSEAYSPAFVCWYRLLFSHLARQGHTLLTVSAFSQARLAAALGVAAARLAVVPSGADHLQGVTADEAVLQRLGLQGQRFFLAVASANPTKNLALLVAAFAELPAAAVPSAAPRLVIVGGSNSRVFSGAPAPADPPGVLRTGPLDDAPLKALYQHAQALVFPSIYEGFGLPPLEAMACGCAVVASNAAAIPEVCGNAAFYVDPLDRAALTAAMQRMLEDPALVQRLRQEGPVHAARYTWAASAERLLASMLAGCPA